MGTERVATTEDLLKKIQELEAGNALLRQQLSNFTPSVGPHIPDPRRTHSSTRVGFPPPSPPPQKAEPWRGCKLTQQHHFQIMDSLGQATHILGPQFLVIYWNHSAEKLYGYTRKEAIGKSICELIIDDWDVPAAKDIITRVQLGERWTGQFPVANKRGDMFPVVCTLTPFYDDDGSAIGAICVSVDARPFKEIKVPIFDTKELQTGQVSSRRSDSVTTTLARDPEEPLQTRIASKLTKMASKVSDRVRSKMKTGDSNIMREGGSGDSRPSDQDGIFSGGSTPQGEPPCGVFSPSSAGDSPTKSPRDASDESEGKNTFQKLTSKAQAWIGGKAMQWSGKGNENEPSEPKSDRSGYSLVKGEENCDNFHPVAKPEFHAGDSNRPAVTEELGSWSSFIVNSASGASSSGSGSGSGSNSVFSKLEAESDCLDYEIMWEDLKFGEQIGQGSCGTVYHGLWYGSDVAIKVFSKQEYSEEVVLSFRQEVSLMKRLRQPNILLFMGAVTSPQRLCIVTEFLPRGSLFSLLQRTATKLDWRRRVHMALDIARGMNYLHSCNPPIIHRDLKSSNLLVDKNWLVKVADFGLSRVKHETYLSTRTGKGTPQWMAPEVLRNERSDEKSDIYSFGVILWELATQKIPWGQLNAMQVICTVGFLNQRLEIPSDVDPRWASIIESCWDSEPQKRPTFRELMETLKDLQRQNTVQAQAARAADQKEL